MLHTCKSRTAPIPAMDDLPREPWHAPYGIFVLGGTYHPHISWCGGESLGTRLGIWLSEARLACVLVSQALSQSSRALSLAPSMWVGLPRLGKCASDLPAICPKGQANHKIVLRCAYKVHVLLQVQINDQLGKFKPKSNQYNWQIESCNNLIITSMAGFKKKHSKHKQIKH